VIRSMFKNEDLRYKSIFVKLNWNSLEFLSRNIYYPSDDLYIADIL
jgi:hypothetical protein